MGIQRARGRDLGTQIEVIEGLTGNETLVASPPDNLGSGQQVRTSAVTGGNK